MADRVTYAKSFFDLQLRFANRVTSLSGLLLARAIMEYTNIHVRFGSGRDFDPAHPVWQEYLAGLQDTNDHGEWTHRFYLTRSQDVLPPNLVTTFGCISYTRLNDSGPITNHVNIVRNAHGQFAYVTVGGLDQVKAFRTDDFQPVATIPVGTLPHGIWPSGDGTRIYVALEQATALAVIDTLSNRQIATIPAGQATQALVFVPNAARHGNGLQKLQPLGTGTGATQLVVVDAGQRPVTHVTLFDQGFVQILQAAVTSLQPKQPYVLGLPSDPKGAGPLVPLATFMANPAGAATVNAVGPIRQYLDSQPKRSPVIIEGTPVELGHPVQVEGFSRR